MENGVAARRRELIGKVGRPFRAWNVLSDVTQTGWSVVRSPMVFFAAGRQPHRAFSRPNARRCGGQNTRQNVLESGQIATNIHPNMLSLNHKRAAICLFLALGTLILSTGR